MYLHKHEETLTDEQIYKKTIWSFSYFAFESVFEHFRSLSIHGRFIVPLSINAAY